MERGLYFAFIAFIMWGVLAISQRYAMIILEADFLLFACTELLLASCILLVMGGKGRTNWETLKSPYSWGWAITRILAIMCFLTAVTHITSTEAMFSIRLYIIISLLMAWGVMKRKPLISDWIGMIPVLGGVVLILSNIGFGSLHIAVAAIVMMAFLESLGSLFTELNKASNQTIGFADRCRFTGTVLGITSIFFIILALAYHMLIPQGINGYVPNFDTLTNGMILLFALFVAACIRAPLMYLEFLSVRLAKSENVRMAGAIGPFIVLGIESILSFFGILDASAISTLDILAGLAITAGAMYMMFFRIANNRRIL